MKKNIFRILLLLLLVPTLLFFITLSSCVPGAPEVSGNKVSVSFNSRSSTGLETVSSADVQVDLSLVSDKDVTVDYEITGTATGSDYTLANGTLTILAGATTGNITIADIIDDVEVEGDETVIITLSNPANATLGANTEHTYTISDNDSAPSVGFNSASSADLESVSSADVQVDLSAAAGEDVTVDYVVTGTATGSGGDAVADYTLGNGTLTILAGATTGNITIADIIDDAEVEGDETVIITLSNPANATLGANTEHTYTISDNDSAPSVGFNSASSAGLESVSSADVQVDLSAAAGEDVTVDYVVTGTATGSGGDAVADYTLGNGTLTIMAGATTGIITIASIIDDPEVEGDETVIITLSNPTNATLGANAEHTYTITDNDSAPSVGFNSASSAGLESVSSADVQVDLSAATGADVTVDYVVTGTATGAGGDAIADYTLGNGTLTIMAGATTGIITIASIIDDAEVEGDETVIITLSNPTNATLGTNTEHTYTITDNDNGSSGALKDPSSDGID